MCDQTEIEFLEGDIVWVKLGSTWWPGEVVGFNNCPEAVKLEAQKKSLIAVVKFFQEENFEYVKNYHQIYKYNCLQKDEFIKKGMDKYRAKEKEKSSLMKNFPEDIKIAEQKTNGNVDILSESKFLPEEKPDISSLFGEPKKPTKKKKEEGRKSIGSGGDKLRKVHRTKSMKPKFKRNVDNLPLLPLSPVNSYYPCYECEFYTTKVNNISFHLRSHKTENGVIIPAKSKSPLKGKQNSQSTPKRKYVKKDKSKVEAVSSDSGKRKQEEEDAVLKKSKMDSTLNDIMADWDVSNDGMDQSMDAQSDNEVENATEEKKDKDKSESDALLDETDKLLKETEKLVSPAKSLSKYTLKSPTMEEKKSDNKYTLKDKLSLTGKAEEKQSEEDKKSRLACFDFNEEDSEPTIPHVRKIPRTSGMPLKKEIIKEFEKSQALKNEKEKKEAIKDGVHEEKGKLELRARKENDADKKLKKTDSDLSLPKNDDMSMDFNETSSVSSMELLKNLDSLIDTCGSPAKSDSPRKREVSISRRDTSSLKRDSSPLKRDSPLKKSFSPSKKEELQSPTRGSASPNKKGSPFRADKSPSPAKKKLNLDYSPPFRAEKLSSPLKSSPQIEENVEILEIVEFEAEDENVNFQKDTEPKTQPVSAFHEDGRDSLALEQDKKDLGNEKDTSFLEESLLSSTTETEEKTAEELVVKKKGRGRPRKNPIAESSTQPETPIKQSLKQSESDSDRSQFSGRRRKPNMRYVNMDSDSYLSSPDRFSQRTDDSQSDTEEQPAKPVEGIKKHTGRRGRRPKSYTLQKEAEEREKKAMEKTELENKDKHVAKVEDKTQNHQESSTEILPPKKSQIKKFEQAQLDLFENKSNKKKDNEEEQTQVLFMEVVEEEVVTTKENLEEKTVEEKSPSKLRNKDSYLPYKPKREFIEENVANSFQEAFVKTMQIDTSAIKEKEEPQIEKKIAGESNLTTDTKAEKLEESDVSVPVKKREKPRIIENVTLKQPLILKSHLLENKSLKHKMEVESPPRKTTHTMAKAQKTNEEQSSLEEMELDINNMPFVYSDDILTPESIEKMPVMISSVPIQTSSTPLKKKSGTPAILSKAKGKPTITSIKSIVPPLEVKGMGPKTTYVLDKPNNVVKYVNNQGVRYVTQPKLTHAQKVPIQSDQQDCKVVQQGTKVVIFQGQGTKALVNMNKTTKVQRIVSNRSQTYTTLATVKSIESMPTTSKVVQKLVLPGNVIQTGVKGGTLLTAGSNVRAVIGTRPKTILTAQPRTTILAKMPTSKGTVLTPITGQEVKRLSAGQKVVQSPQQIPLLSRMKKIPVSEQISLATGMSPGTSIVYKSPGNTVRKTLTTRQIVMPSQSKLITKISPKIVVTKGKQVLSKNVHSETTTPVITKTTTPKTLASSPAKGVVQQKNLLSVAWSSALGDVDEQTASAEVEEKTEQQVVVADEPKTEAAQPEDKAEEMKMIPGQFYAVQSKNPDGSPMEPLMYFMYVADEHGNLTAIDNNDAAILGESGALNNLVIQTPDNGDVSIAKTESSASSETTCTGNQDILAAALANTDFQQDLETTAVTISSTNLINQTMMQPTSEPISLTSVLETSLTINQPIMTPLEVPSNMPTQSETLTNVPSVTKIPATSLELPITITDPNISYIAAGESQLMATATNSIPEIGDIIGDSNVTVVEANHTETPTTQYIVIPGLQDNIILEQTQNEEEIPAASYSVSIAENDEQVQTTPSMPIIDDGFTETFTETVETTTESEFPDSEISKTDFPTRNEEADKVEATIETEEITTQGCLEAEKSADTVDAVVVEETIESSVPDDTLKESTLLHKEEAKTSETHVEEKHDDKDVEKHEVVEEQIEDVQMEETEPSVQEVVPDQVSYELMDTSEPLTEECPVVETSESTSKPAIEEEAIEEPATAASSQDDHVTEQPSEPVEAIAEAMDVDEVDKADSCAAVVEDAECVTATAAASAAAELDEAETSQEAPSQSYEIPSQSFDAEGPTQSFLENRIAEADEVDPSFPTQSYEVDKAEHISEALDTDAELSEEGNLPSQSNDDGIGTSSLTNSLGFNEDETASSSYVPETPETQERDQDQESAISTSSYEIAPCEDLNIASSSVIPDTSEHMSIHDNGVPEIPTSSYSLNPDSSSTHRDAVPTSSFEDQVIVEHNVSTSYDVPISMPGLEDASSQNFVSESGSSNEPSSYYQQVSASYYNVAGQGAESRLKSADAEVSASYYESAARNEASQSYFVGEEATQSFCGQNLSSGYYDAQADAEAASASQSFYSAAGQNVEASQSFYQEASVEQRDGEATPASYPMDYAAADSPIDRHDLVESSSARQR